MRGTRQWSQIRHSIFKFSERKTIHSRPFCRILVRAFYRCRDRTCMFFIIHLKENFFIKNKISHNNSYRVPGGQLAAYVTSKAFRSLERASEDFEKKIVFPTFNLNSLIINTDFGHEWNTYKKFPKIVPRNVDLSTPIVTVWLISSSWVSRTRTRIRDISQTSTWETIFVVFRRVESSSDSEDEAEEKEEGVRFASPRLSRTWYPPTRSLYHSHTRHRYKMKVPQILTPPQTPVMMQRIRVHNRREKISSHCLRKYNVFSYVLFERSCRSPIERFHFFRYRPTTIEKLNTR